MKYKILESHIIFNHPHGDYIISVAIESAQNRWKAYHKQVSELSEQCLHIVARTGEKLTKQRAKEIFPGLSALEDSGHIENEN